MPQDGVLDGGGELPGSYKVNIQSIYRINHHSSKWTSSSVEDQLQLEPDILEARFNEILVQFQQAEISNRSLEAQEERIIIQLLELIEEIRFCEHCIARQNDSM